MATPNGKGGWDLTDDDVTEVMAASFGKQDDPRYTTVHGGVQVPQTDHLPECPCYLAVRENVCICDRLRACEQRVTERHNAEHEDDRLTAFQNGYAEALDAARDAVEALIVGSASEEYVNGVDASLAAIDALRGES